MTNAYVDALHDEYMRPPDYDEDIEPKKVAECDCCGANINDDEDYYFIDRFEMTLCSNCIDDAKVKPHYFY